MNYHNIVHDDMRNGPGMRVTLFVSGCDHRCKNCQNPQTWDPKSGIPFDKNAYDEIMEYLGRDYIKGITFSGGDPMNFANIASVYTLTRCIREAFPDKTIMVYTGYTVEELIAMSTWRSFGDEIPCGVDAKESTTGPMNFTKSYVHTMWKLLKNIDMLVDGKFDESLADVNYPWAGSTNQKVLLDFQDYLETNYPDWYNNEPEDGGLIIDSNMYNEWRIK